MARVNACFRRAVGRAPADPGPAWALRDLMKRPRRTFLRLAAGSAALKVTVWIAARAFLVRFFQRKQTSPPASHASIIWSARTRIDGGTERRGGPPVYDHLEFPRKLHREIVRLLAAKNAMGHFFDARVQWICLG